MPTLLIVDDDVSTIDILRSVFEEEGYVVVDAPDGKRALELAHRVRPNIVLCDAMMPVMDGPTLCGLMKNDPAFKSIPFLMMSAARDAARETSCTFDLFVSKPFDIDELVTTISRFVDGRTPS